MPAQLLTSKIFLYSCLCILPLGTVSVLLGMSNFYEDDFACENLKFIFRWENLLMALLFTLQLFFVIHLLKKKKAGQIN